MKKYFVKETEEEIEFGDVIGIEFYKELKDGKVTVEKQVTFSEDNLDLLIEMGFVEEGEVEDDEMVNFDDNTPCEALEGLYDKVSELEEKIEKLEELESLVKTIHGTLLNIQKNLKKDNQKK